MYKLVELRYSVSSVFMIKKTGKNYASENRCFQIMSQNELNPCSRDYHKPLKLFCLPEFLALLPTCLASKYDLHISSLM